MNLKSGYSYLLPYTQKEIQVFKNYQTTGGNKIILHSLFPVIECQTWIEYCWDAGEPFPKILYPWTNK